MEEALKHCTLCPRQCGVNRMAGERGFCGAGAQILAARAGLHFWEEPCLSGTAGSGAVFFSTCTLRCSFCQNFEISQGGVGFPLSAERLVEIFWELKEKGANNLNLVSPTPFLPMVVSALRRAKAEGLSLPVILNCGGYERAETIRTLEGLVDIYLPDLKYASNAYAKRYSGAADYTDYALPAINEMVRQTGNAVFDEAGIMQSGTIIRHLMLPGLVEDTKAVIRLVSERYAPKGAYFSLMNQYTPVREVPGCPELSETVDPLDYRDAVSYARFCGITNGFIQEGGTVAESFIPAFDGEGIVS